MWKITLLVITVVLAIVSKFLYGAFSDLDQLTKPLEENPFWGPAHLKSAKEDTKIYPFKINVEESVLKNLKSELAEEINSKKFTPPLEGTAFHYGFNTKYLQTLLSYWESKYDWREREKLLNRYPQFTTKVFGLDIHFQHVPAKDKSKDKVPLLMLHGWPGSFVELQKMIPMLTEQSDINFELIIPSLPGYGFSSGAARPYLGTLGMSQIFLKLMQRLGFEKFYVHGGDWGALITVNMATLYPEHVKALHSNCCINFHNRSILRLIFATLFPSLVMTAEETERFTDLAGYMSFIARETGYLHIQATKPDTVGVGLLHSPSGLAAYIVEKFSTWTNEGNLKEIDGGLTKAFTMDELLDNVMIYWVTNSITTSMRLYSEFFGSPQELAYGVDRIPSHVPTGCIVAKNDAYLRQSEWVLRDKFQNIAQFSLAKVGGHFLAMEHPRLLADDIIKFFSLIEKQNLLK